MRYLTSSFSLQMIPQGGHLQISPTNLPLVLDGTIARIGHEGTAKVLSARFCRTFAVDRTPVQLGVGDTLLVAQPCGTRFAPGTEIEEPILSFFWVHVLPASQQVERRLPRDDE